MTPQEEIEELKQRLADLEWRLTQRSFDYEKEYDFVEAAKLAFENPGWTFGLECKESDPAFQLMYKPEINAYFINGLNEIFKLSHEDLKSKWKRVR